MIRLTIFTPTYNRGYILGNLYKSLCEQSKKDFIWLVVDDGSTDNTKDLVDKWVKEADFNIKYIKKDNGGKNTAMDTANELCETDYICCVDSDDILDKNAVDIIYNEMLMADKLKNSCGIVTRKGRIDDGTPYGEGWVNEKYKEIYFFELSKKYKYKSETCLVFKTEIVRKYKFPVIKDEKFITESVFYNQFMYNYTLLASREIYYYFEYIQDGYTRQGMKIFFQNPKGFLYALKQNLFYAKKVKLGLKACVGLSAGYYAWKKINKIDDTFSEEYKISGFYKFFGILLSPIQYIKYRKLQKLIK